MAQLQCILVTPEQTVRDEQADFVALPLYDGEIGIAPFHSAMIGRLGNGELRIQVGDVISRYYVEGGFVEVNNDVVSVLTNRAVPAEELDEAVARELLATARTRPANTPELMALRDLAVDQARAQIQVAQRAG
jgi:F-type H+-transporting ATPase subunit epsilon